MNAKSIDGYFGVGTSCFFIRGTILSDTPVDGEYPSLSFMRPGNVVEIAAFDGVWAVVTIRTRPGNRPGDNVSASLYLRDDDLKAHGVDCGRIVNLNGLPFAFDVASLAAEGLFDHHDLEPYAPVEDDPGSAADSGADPRAAAGRAGVGRSALGGSGCRRTGTGTGAAATACPGTAAAGPADRE